MKGHGAAHLIRRGSVRSGESDDGPVLPAGYFVTRFHIGYLCRVGEGEGRDWREEEGRRRREGGTAREVWCENYGRGMREGRERERGRGEVGE